MSQPSLCPLPFQPIAFHWNKFEGMRNYMVVWEYAWSNLCLYHVEDHGEVDATNAIMVVALQLLQTLHCDFRTMNVVLFSRVDPYTLGAQQQQQLSSLITYWMYCIFFKEVICVFDYYRSRTKTFIGEFSGGALVTPLPFIFLNSQVKDQVSANMQVFVGMTITTTTTN